MKQDRVEFRTSNRERRQIEKAAAFLGMNVSSFLRKTALERSIEVLKSSDTLTLNDADRDLFLNALENPPKPNKNLINAFRFYENFAKKRKRKK